MEQNNKPTDIYLAVRLREKNQGWSKLVVTM